MANTQNWWEKDKPVAQAGSEWWSQDKPVLAEAPSAPVATQAVPTERPEDQSFFRKVADIPLQFQKGYVSGIRLIADAFGADSGVSKSLRGVEEHLAGLMSAQSKQDSAEMARIMKDAEDKGIGAQVVAGVKALSVAPIDTVVNALGTTAPTILAGIAGGLPAAGVLGATMGAGTVKSAVYESVKEVLGGTKMSPQEVEQRAVKAQEYLGQNLDMIATGAALGVLESITGSQAAAKRITDRILARGVAKEAAEGATEEVAKKTMMGAVASGALKEATPEFLQGAQEQLSRNIAQQREGFDTPTMRGVITQGVLEGGAGAMIGGVTGPIELAVERQKVTELKDKIDGLQNTPPPPGSDEERVLQLAAQLEARGNVDRQNAMIMAMKIVADENIQSEKIDGPKPPEITGGAPLFIFDTAEQAQERTELLKKNRPKENFAFQEMPNGKFGIYKIPVETTGVTNVAEPIDETGGAGTELLGERDAGVPAGGAATPVPTGLDATGAVTQQPDVGEAVQPAPLDVAADAIAQVIDNGIAANKTRQQILDEVKTLSPDYLNLINLNAVNDTLTQLGVKEDQQAEVEAAPAAVPIAETTLPEATTITEEPSVTETTEAQQTEEERQAEPAAEVAPEIKSAQELLAAIDEGGVPLNPAKLNNIARDIGLDVSKSAKPEETIQRIRDAVQRATTPAATAAPESTEVISAVETEAKAAIDEVNAATEELTAAMEERDTAAATREKGQGEPAVLRRMTKDASKKLEAAITGTGKRPSGLIHIIKKLDVAIDQARAALDPYGGEEFDPDLLRERGLTLGDKLSEAALGKFDENEKGDVEAILSEDQKAELFAQDMAEMRDAYARFNGLKALRAEAIRKLAVFESSIITEGHPSKAAATAFVRTLPYEDKLAAYEDVSKQEGRVKEQLEEAAAEPKAPAKPAAPPVVTVKKKRQVIIPPASQARVSKRVATSLKTDPTFNQFSGMSITASLQHIAETGNPFERALATRLLARDNRAGVKDTKMYVLDEKGVQKLENTEADMEGAAGLYFLGKNGDAIFLRGEQFDENGINNQTVLHEALHATVNKRIIYAMYARDMGLPVSESLERTVAELNELLNRAETALDQFLADSKTVPENIQHLIDGGAFDTVTEFVTYGMTDPAMQRFLRDNVEGVVTKRNGLADFVRLILDMMGLGPEHVSGLRDLIEYTNNLAASVSVDPATARKVLDTAKENKVLDIQAASKAAKRKESKSEEIQRKVEESSSADQIIEELGSLSTVAKNPKLWGEYLSAKFTDINVDGMNVLLAAMPTNVVVEMGVDKGITRLADIDSDTREMATMRTRILNRVQEIATPWIKLSGPVQKQLGKVMAAATLAQVDPATNKTSDKTLYDMYNSLPDEAKAVYKNVRDFYADQYALYQALLERAAIRMGGEENAKGTLASIRTLYEVAKNKGPYFPLMRYGQFYARFGKGASKEFYMFESAGLRDAFVTRKMAELAKKGETRTFDEMIETDDADRGNDVEGMRKEMLKDNMQLKNIFDMIDKASGLGDEKIRAALKDQIYQMQLMMMPEASMRKHFIHRKGITGFSGDALRNFLNSGTRMASQIARVRYSTDISNNLSAAKESLKGNPEKDKLSAIIKEVEARANDELNPPIDDTLLERLARKTNKVAFLYMLTSVKSAANQMFSILNFTLPTLAARHGWIPAMKEMGKYLALGYGQMGVVKTNIDGSTSWVAPTIALSDQVVKNPDEQYAVQRMQDMGISDATRTYDLFLRRGQPSVDYNGFWNKVTGTMGALFHHSERISREITFMSSFRLARAKGMTREQAVEQAVNDTNTALFDYSAWNRPRVLRPAPVRMVAQFKQFPMYVTLYLARNGYNIIKSGATAQERKEAATMLFGTLGMTALMAGASGSFGYSVIMGTIQGIRNALRDDDEEDPLEEKDFELWFRNVWLPEFFGDAKIMGMKLSELIDSGVLNTATGFDVASGISLNNLWFHDTPDANRWKSGFDNLLISMMGPGVSVGRQAAASIDDFNNGEFLKGTEKLLPAFFRGTATAIRYDQEGAKSTTGAEIKAKEDFTMAQLAAQMMGFRTTGLAQVMNNNFAIQQMVNGLKNERAGLMKQLDIAIQSDNDQNVEDVLDSIFDFSARYPTYEIKPKEIAASLKAREKIRTQSEAGLYLDKRAKDFEVLRDRILDNLEREVSK